MSEKLEWEKLEEVTVDGGGRDSLLIIDIYKSNVVERNKMNRRIKLSIRHQSYTKIEMRKSSGNVARSSMENVSIVHSISWHERERIWPNQKEDPQYRSVNVNQREQRKRNEKKFTNWNTEWKCHCAQASSNQCWEFMPSIRRSSPERRLRKRERQRSISSIEFVHLPTLPSISAFHHVSSRGREKTATEWRDQSGSSSLYHCYPPTTIRHPFERKVRRLIELENRTGPGVSSVEMVWLRRVGAVWLVVFVTRYWKNPSLTIDEIEGATYPVDGLNCNPRGFSELFWFGPGRNESIEATAKNERKSYWTFSANHWKSSRSSYFDSLSRRNHAAYRRLFAV